MSALCECGCGSPAPIATRTNYGFGHTKGEPMRFVRGHANGGKRFSTEVRARMSAGHPRGEAAPNWKAEGFAYSTVHGWLRKVASKTGECSACGARPKTRTEWANLSGSYLRDITDYAEMCVSCHHRYDRTRREAA